MENRNEQDSHMKELCGCDSCKAWREYRDQPCYGCGMTGNHPELGGHYWPCGTMKCSSIRGEGCYEAELTFLRYALEEIAKARGAYSFDRAQFYKNCIEQSIKTAQNALLYPKHDPDLC